MSITTKTANLSAGSIKKVSFERKYPYIYVKNLSDNGVYVSEKETFDAYDDNVTAIPAHTTGLIYRNTELQDIYIRAIAAGKVEILGAFDANLSFNYKNSTEGGGGGQPVDAYTKSQTDAFLADKVDKISGKGLSTNDFTTAEKTKLAGLSNYDDSALQTAVSKKVEFTDYATGDKAGVVKASAKYGVGNTSNNELKVVCANESEISAGTNIYKPIVPACLGNAMAVYGINSKTQIADMQTEIEENQDSMQFENLIENYTIPNPYTHKGVTFTTNSDGSITVTGQSTATYSTGAIIRNISIEHKKYFLTGCPDGGSDSTFRLATVLGGFSTGIDVDYGDGTIVDNTDGKYDNGGLGVMMVIYPGINFTENPVTFRPMLIPGTKPYHRYESMLTTRAALRRDIDALIALL